MGAGSSTLQTGQMTPTLFYSIDTELRLLIQVFQQYVYSTHTALTHLLQFETVVWATGAQNHAYFGCWSKVALHVGV